MDDGEAFLERLGHIHKAIHVSGRTVLDAVLRTAVEMLTDRGCHAITTADEPMDAILAQRPVVRSAEAHVYIHTEDRVGVKFARAMIEQSDGVQCICVNIDGPTAFTRNELQGRNVQFMLCKSLFVNITHHALVPRHRLLADDEVRFERTQLPILAQTDPVVQYYAWPVGGVVEIDRVFGGSEPLKYYRVIQASN